MTIELVLSILIGLYLLADSIYLASITDGENRYCMIAKYVGAAMSGFYILVEVHSGVSILFGGTIALFMWPETYLRLMKYLRINYPSAYQVILRKVKQNPSIRPDNEAFN